MGTFKDVHMSKNEYNDLFVLFYAGYLVALWPGAWISQRVGHKHFTTGSLFLWALLLGVHPAVKTDRVPNCSLNRHSSPGVFPSEEESLGATQLPLIVVGFGFTPAESALFNIIKPIWGFILIIVSALLLYSTRLGTGYTCAISYIPCFVGGIIELASPWSNKVALVVGSQISTFKPSYLLGLSWAGTTTTGHTKKLCLMTSCIVAASVANMISPEFWRSKYIPRYVLPWALMTAFWLISPAMCIVIRFYLKRENKRREKLLAETDTNSDQDGVIHFGGQLVHIGDRDYDKTDRENLKFLYPL
ncbi:hypothetical protein PDIDSM_4202 [Penicillium digitatum]|nr:hypothetical protein PDIDSM_4202 [Penicillium digitatum]